MEPRDDDARSTGTASGGGRDPFQNVLRREGEYWTIRFDGVVARLRDSAGLRYIAMLLSRPGERIPVTVLVGASARGDGAGVANAAAVSPLDAALAVERARINVTRAIGAALKRLSQHHPALAMHLHSTLRTGTSCVYTPDSRLPIVWEM